MTRFVKISFFISVSFVFFIHSDAQLYDKLDINNLSVRINSSGDLFNNYLQKKSEFEAPKATGKTPAYTSSLWIGGFDDKDRLHIAAQAYRSIASDYWEGPIGDKYDISYRTKYRRVYKISKSEIDYFIQTGIPSQNILDWPAHGNTENGEAAYLAPFIDVNGDKHYKPEDGDYPEIKGDQAVYFIFNDDQKLHGESKGEKLKCEVHGLAYAFSNTSDIALNNTFFVGYKIINRSANNYYSLYTGVFTDFDLGNYSDDFIGCDSSKNLYFAYNGDSIDEGSAGYGQNPPALGVLFLNRRMTSFVGFQSNSCPVANPCEPLEYYNSIGGYWPDGSAIYYGGNGYDKYVRKQETKYLYNGGPANGNQDWTEIQAGHTPGDRRSIGSIGPFDLNSGEAFEFEIAYIFSEATKQELLSGLENLYRDADYIKNYYTTYLNTKQAGSPLSKQLEVYPNPATNRINIILPEKLNSSLIISVYDSKACKINNIEYSYCPSENKVELNIPNTIKGFCILNVSINGNEYNCRLIVP
jgi:hypothetical protein